MEKKELEHTKQENEKNGTNDAVSTAGKNKEQKKRPQKIKKKKNFMIAMIIILVCVAGGAAYGVNWYLTKDDPDKFIQSALAEDGTLKKGVNEKELKKKLQQKTDESMTKFSINTNPEFLDGKTEGTFCIENKKDNTYYIQVEVRLEETGETVFRTKNIKPGFGIQTGALYIDLDKGDYPATAIISFVNPKTNKTTSSASAALTLSVLG